MTISSTLCEYGDSRCHHEPPFTVARHLSVADSGLKHHPVLWLNWKSCHRQSHRNSMVLIGDSSFSWPLLTCHFCIPCAVFFFRLSHRSLNLKDWGTGKPVSSESLVHWGKGFLAEAMPRPSLFWQWLTSSLSEEWQTPVSTPEAQVGVSWNPRTYYRTHWHLPQLFTPQEQPLQPRNVHAEHWSLFFPA